MAGDRYVLLGLAPPRSTWFRVVAQWANSGTIPAEFVKCLSAAELRARLASGRPFSAALVDASLPALDRDLVDAAGRAECPVVAVAGHRAGDGREQLGMAAVLPEYFDPKTLTDCLAVHARTISRADAVADDVSPQAAPGWRGQVAMVCGPGGTGASTAAVALAQGLAGDPRHGGSVLLADLALNAEQAMLHDARDVVPGVQELVEAHRSAQPRAQDVRGLTYKVEERGYHLLLGLRQARAWSSLRPRSFAAAFHSLRGAYRVTVCDSDADLEGEADGGSVDVEERNIMARTAAAQADVVLVVGVPGMKGLHSLVRVLNEVRSFGVPATRTVPVVNRAPKGPRARAELTAALAALTAPALEGESLPSPVFLPERRVDESLRDGARLPDALTQPLAGAFSAVALQGERTAAGEPERVRPGSLGSWADQAQGEAAFG